MSHFEYGNTKLVITLDLDDCLTLKERGDILDKILREIMETPMIEYGEVDVTRMTVETKI